VLPPRLGAPGRVAHAPRPASCTLRAVAGPQHDESFVDRLSRQGEDALGRIAEELIANPVVNGALTRAFEAREKAVQAQEAAMGALNIPSAADIERITRRLRSVSQRLEGIEDALDRVEERVAASPTAGDDRWATIQERLDEIERDLSALRKAVAPGEEPPPRAQERLTVSDS
jgi:tetrahydromethanopterin S-methyltransferase subunit G